MIKQLQTTLLFIVFFSIPIQLGKHFWPSFSFVSGIRVDYLSPTLYVSDLFIFLLFCSWLFEFFTSKTLRVRFIKILHKKIIFLILGAAFFLLQLFTVVSVPSYLYGVVKVFELLFFALFVSYRFKKSMIPFFAKGFLVIGLLEVFLAFAQFFSQHSINGIFYFIGERAYDVTSFGVAKFSVFNTVLVRPYGTFPHPNVLAFFLLFSATLTLFYFFELQKRTPHVIYALFAVLSLGILSTLSRTVMLCYFFLLIWFFARNMLSRAFFAFLTLLLFFSLLLRFDLTSLEKDIGYRAELIDVSYRVLSQHVFVGTGLNNYLYHQVVFQREISPVLLQPVHNVYFLILTQIGIIGFVLLGHFLFLTARRVYDAIIAKSVLSIYPQFVAMMLLFVALIGLFDHYFLTLQQGQLMLALLFGLSWSRS